MNEKGLRGRREEKRRGEKRLIDREMIESRKNKSLKSVSNNSHYKRSVKKQNRKKHQICHSGWIDKGSGMSVVPGQYHTTHLSCNEECQECDVAASCLFGLDGQTLHACEREMCVCVCVCVCTWGERCVYVWAWCVCVCVCVWWGGGMELDMCV